MDEFGDFFPLFLAVSRRLESISIKLGPPLSVEESQILTFILSRNSQRLPVTAHAVGDFLKIEKSSLSRKLAKLQQSGFVKQVRGSTDRRTKLLEITSLGSSTLVADQQTRDRQIEEFAIPLGASHRGEFTSLVKAVADNLSAPEVSLSTKDHPLKLQIARLTRSLGFLGSNLFETGFPLEECQLLTVLRGKALGLSLTDLKAQLPYDKSKMSRLIQAYETRGLVQSRLDPLDKRRIVVTLTRKGAEEAEAIQGSARKLFIRGLGPISKQQREQLRDLIAKVIEPKIAECLPQDGQIQFFRSPRDRSLARGFIIEQLVRLRLHREAPSSIARAESQIAGLLEHGQVQGVLEWSSTESTVRIENLVCCSTHGFGQVSGVLLDFLTSHIAPEVEVEVVAPYLGKALQRAGGWPSRQMSLLEFRSIFSALISLG